MKCVQSTLPYHGNKVLKCLLQTLPSIAFVHPVGSPDMRGESKHESQQKRTDSDNDCSATAAHTCSTASKQILPHSRAQVPSPTLTMQTALLAIEVPVVDHGGEILQVYYTYSFTVLHYTFFDRQISKSPGLLGSETQMGGACSSSG